MARTFFREVLGLAEDLLENEVIRLSFSGQNYSSVLVSTRTAAVQQRLQAEVPKQDAAAIAAMKRSGLTVTEATGPEWRQAIDALAKTMRGEMVPPDMFDLAVKARDAYRRQHPAGQAK